MADLAAIRRAFEQAAPHYDAHAFLQQEVARRLDENLAAMKIVPQRILDAGCGTGSALPLLRARYPDASLIALDLAEGMVHEALRQHGQPKGLRRWLKLLAPIKSFAGPSQERLDPLGGWVGRFFRPGGSTLPSLLTAVTADLQHLPLATHSVDLVWSSLALQWVDLDTAFSSVKRVLKPGGLFIFASFGPDTLKELRAASADLDGHAHVNRFIDMHDVGDALVHAGFADPVMEMERITLTYADLKGLLADLKGIGAHTVLEGGRRGLMGKSTWRRLLDNYETFRRDGRLPATYEIVYGHAWGAEPRQLDDGRQIIQWKKP